LEVPRIDIEGFRLTVNTRDEKGHRPHVHVLKGGEKCKVLLDAIGTPYDIRMSKPNVARARELIVEHFDQLLGWWRKYHG
jgi:hypothetical protein